MLFSYICIYFFALIIAFFGKLRRKDTTNILNTQKKLFFFRMKAFSFHLILYISFFLLTFAQKFLHI